jgi:hypothetical protein
MLLFGTIFILSLNFTLDPENVEAHCRVLSHQ